MGKLLYNDAPYNYIHYRYCLHKTGPKLSY